MSLLTVPLPFEVKTCVLALGSHTKNTVCLIRGTRALVSPVHNNLSDPGDFSLFLKDAKHFLREKPRMIACDLHPEYRSTAYAGELEAAGHPLFPVQHHHAHLAACMAEAGLKNQKVIGVAFDGTGLGSDGRIWGAEFLVCDYKGFERKAHLQEVPLLGGEQAVMEPWRLLLAWLWQTHTAGDFRIGSLRKITAGQRRVLRKMYLTGFNAPLASSMGRLFDAIASLVLGRGEAHFEAELAIALERTARRYRPVKPTGYAFRVIKTKGSYVIDPRPMFRKIFSALHSRAPKEEIAYNFHYTVAQMIRVTCSALRKDSKINRVALSGGVFQNKLLLETTLDLLYKDAFDAHCHTRLPCNDACVSLGQALIAYCRKR